MLLLSQKLLIFRCNAKLLWKRIPSDEKQANPILGLIWNVGQKLWQRDHYSVFSLLKKTEWPELVAPFMKSLEDSFRQRSLHLIEKAYISINTTAFANLSGYTDSPEDAEKLLTTLTQEQGWLFDTSSQLIIPKRSQNQVVPLMRHEDQLQSLTQLVSFLEN